MYIYSIIHIDIWQPLNDIKEGDNRQEVQHEGRNTPCDFDEDDITNNVN